MLEDLGLLLVLLGLDTLVEAAPARCPLELFDSLRNARCVDASSRNTSCGDDNGRVSGVCTPYVGYIILAVLFYSYAALLVLMLSMTYSHEMRMLISERANLISSRTNFTEYGRLH